jgi:hypothetical protein
MNMSSLIAVGIGYVMLLMCAGCSHMHRVVNTGDTMLYAVTVQSGEREFGHGYLPPKAATGYSGSMRIWRSPAPVVSWKMAENGPLVVQEVSLDSEPYWREVVFEIDGKTAKGVVRNP